MDIQEVALPSELQAQLKAPMPEGAVKPHPTKSYLSTIKPAFVIERMNDVFGIGGYREIYREISVTSREEEYESRKALVFSATVHATLMIPKYGIHLENFGGSKNEDAGDALKGACTDAFTKMCSHLGVGLEIYKGKADGAKGDDLPPCPVCKKTGAIIKGKEEFGGGWLCFGKKGGCGSKFTDAEMEQIKSGKVAEPSAPKPAQSTQQPLQQQPANGIEKKTIAAKVTERKRGEDGRLYLQVGTYACVAIHPVITGKLNRAWTGADVELLISDLGNGKHQIHKVIGVKAPGGAK